MNHFSHSISMLNLYEVIIEFKYYLAESWNIITVIGEIGGEAVLLWFFWLILYDFLVGRLKIGKQR